MKVREILSKRTLSLLVTITFTTSALFVQNSPVFAKDNFNRNVQQREMPYSVQNSGGNKNKNENASSLSTTNNNGSESVLQSVYQNVLTKDVKSESDKKERQIIVKYTDVSKADIVRASIKKKLPITKLDIKGKNKITKKEILEIGDNDNIDSIVNELKKDKNVLYAQKNNKLYINDLPQDPRFGEEWGLLNNGQSISNEAGIAGIDIGVMDAWNITKGSPDVVIGVIDTGIDKNHIDLKDRIYINTKEVPNNNIDDDGNGYIDDINGFDFYNNDSTVFDGSSYDTHGTHVAGIIAASANNEGVRGVAPNVKLLPLKFINGNYGYTSDAIDAIEYAKAMGIKVINCSWGSTENNPALYDAMNNSGILFVSAAGNNSSNVETAPVYPACFDLPNVISVAAVDNAGNLAAFSNYGNKVDIAAPGVNILSTLSANSYGYMNGTSMAAPFVTGVAALLL